jgi:hypothetical protein
MANDGGVFSFGTPFYGSLAGSGRRPADRPRHPA